MDFGLLADQSIRGEILTREEALGVLRAPEGELDALLEATFEVRRRFHGMRVKLCMLLNAQSGLCSEDCRYCSQSSVSKAEIERYPLRGLDALVDGARRAAQSGARRYCMVTSGRTPSEKYIERFCQAAREIKARYALELCCSPGLLDESQARRLKDAGIDFVNHNLNTSERFHPRICTTHTYQDRVNTLRAVAAAGLKSCSGGIVGMGESDEDIADLAGAVRALEIDSIPVNFLHPVPGTPLEGVHYLTPEKCLKVLCLFRLLNPMKEIRAAGGREFHLGERQYLALKAVNSIFIDGYLTTPGMDALDAVRMIESHGYEVELEQVESCGSLDAVSFPAEPKA